jgi:ribosomal protein L11 methyltransferase
MEIQKSVRQWLSISLRVPGESEEAISNFLIERGASGIEEAEESPRSKTVKAYFLKDGSEKKILHALNRYLKSIEGIYPGISRFQVEVSSLEEKDWSGSWRRFFKPVTVSSRFVVAPPWSSVRSGKGRILIRINPGMAFGTGTHATTQLCLKALEHHLRRGKRSVLDVGTGSGILAIASSKLGSPEVVAIDTDGAALGNARENMIMNNVLDRVRVRHCSIGAVRRSFDVVVANIDSRNLRRMRRALLHHVRDEGLLILSGILGEEMGRLRHHYLDTGVFRWAREARQDEWGSLTLKKR